MLENNENNFTGFIIEYKTYILEFIVLIIFLIGGMFLYLDYAHKQSLEDGAVRQEILNDVNEVLRDNLNLIELKKEHDEVSGNLSENDLQELNRLQKERQEKENADKNKFNEEKLFEFLTLESQPNYLDNLMNDLVIKNNSTATPDETCTGTDLLENDECKKSLFVGCAEALFLKFAIVNECVQFQKADYVEYIKGKKLAIQNLDNLIKSEVKVQTEFGEVIPSSFTLSRADLQDTIDSSVLNNDFTKADFSDVVNDSQIITLNEVEMQIQKEVDEEERLKQKMLSEKKLQNQKILNDVPERALNNLLSSLTGVMVKYSGWVQGWATVFATNGGRAEAGFKMYKTTAFGFNPYHPKNCMISLPYKTVDKFFGTSLNYCVRNGILKCIYADKEKVKGKPIEVLMIKNGKREIFPLGDLGPAEWTGNALDLNGCAAKKLGGSGKDQVRFRVAK